MDAAIKDDPLAILNRIMFSHDLDFNVCEPAEVVKVYNDRTVVVQPLTKMISGDKKSNTYAEKIVEPIRVSLMTENHGGFFVEHPVMKGDTGWVFASDRNTSLIKQYNSSDVPSDNEGAQTPNDDQNLHKSHFGFFMPDRWITLPKQLVQELKYPKSKDEKVLCGGDYVIGGRRNAVGNLDDSALFGIVRDMNDNDVPFIADEEGHTRSLDGKYTGKYFWQRMVMLADGSFDIYGQGKKFSVRGGGLYRDDRLLKFLSELVISAGDGIEVTMPERKDGMVEYKIANKGVIELESGDNVTIEPVEGKVGVFKISATGGGSGTLQSITIDSPDRSVTVTPDGTETDPVYHLKVVHPQIGSGTITIKKNGIAIGSFSVNQTDNNEINIEVPDQPTPTGSYYIDVDDGTGGTTKGQIKAKVPESGKGLVTLDTRQTIDGNKTFSNMVTVANVNGTAYYYPNAIYLKATQGNPWISFFDSKTSQTAKATIQLSNSSRSSGYLLLLARETGITLTAPTNKVALSNQATDDTETDSTVVPTMGWVNDKFLRIDNLIPGDNIAITPGADKKLTISANANPAPFDIVSRNGSLRVVNCRFNLNGEECNVLEYDVPAGATSIWLVGRYSLSDWISWRLDTQPGEQSSRSTYYNFKLYDLNGLSVTMDYRSTFMAITCGVYSITGDEGAYDTAEPASLIGNINANAHEKSGLVIRTVNGDGLKIDIKNRQASDAFGVHSVISPSGNVLSKFLGTSDFTLSGGGGSSITADTTFDVIVGIRYDISSGYIQVKKRTANVQNGIVTSFSSESDWTNAIETTPHSV